MSFLKRSLKQKAESCEPPIKKPKPNSSAVKMVEERRRVSKRMVRQTPFIKVGNSAKVFDKNNKVTQQLVQQFYGSLGHACSQADLKSGIPCGN